MNYERVYLRLINAAKSRNNCGYTEKHHIIPKAHGGTNDPENIVALTAREHFLAHWLLVKVYKSPAMARAFRLLTDTNKKRRGRNYEYAKQSYAKTMVGNQNVAKRPEVRAKIRAKLLEKHPYTGIKRPEHARIMREQGRFSGVNNMWYGKGDRQLGAKNHMARSIIGKKGDEIRQWDTLQYAANELGVTIQAICQALKKQQRSKGWKLEYKV